MDVYTPVHFWVFKYDTDKYWTEHSQIQWLLYIGAC